MSIITHLSLTSINSPLWAKREYKLLLISSMKISTCRQDSPYLVKTGQLDFSLRRLKGKVTENLGDVQGDYSYFKCFFPLYQMYSSFHKISLTIFTKWSNKQICNKILNIKLYRQNNTKMGDYYICEYIRKSRICGEKRMTSKNWRRFLSKQGKTRPN